MYSIKEKSIAVASGKGGVGKTTTSVNIAILFAKNGLKTAIVDIDPLSDISTLFDIQDIGENKANTDIINIFPGLDLVYPNAKTNNKEIPLIKKFLSIKKELVAQYDKIIFDLPAGSLYEENLIFLQFTSKVIIVTNDEPTSHTASGYYIKKAYENGNDVEFLIWHNKYAGITIGGFNPKDLSGNYNSNVSKEDQFDFSKVRMRDVAFIPKDSAMDLLQDNTSFILNVLALMSERVDFIIEQRIDEVSESLELTERTSFLIKHYLHLNPFVRDIDSSYKKISEYIYSIINSSILTKDRNYNKLALKGGLKIFSETEELEILKLLKKISKDSLINELLKVSAQLKLGLDEQNKTGNSFYSIPEQSSYKKVDRRISLLLQMLNAERNEHNDYIKTTATLLQFDFAIYKLLLSKTVINLLANFIPQKTNSRGQKIRDKNKQILMLVKKDDSYKKEYLKLINILFPVVLKQLITITETFNTKELCFKNESGLQKSVYLKILSNFLHNSLNSGLGIVSGFPYRPASEAFEKYTKSLM